MLTKKEKKKIKTSPHHMHGPHSVITNSHYTPHFNSTSTPAVLKKNHNTNDQTHTSHIQRNKTL